MCVYRDASTELASVTEKCITNELSRMIVAPPEFRLEAQGSGIGGNSYSLSGPPRRLAPPFPPSHYHLRWLCDRYDPEPARCSPSETDAASSYPHTWFLTTSMRSPHSYHSEPCWRLRFVVGWICTNNSSIVSPCDTLTNLILANLTWLPSCLL